MGKWKKYNKNAVFDVFWVFFGKVVLRRFKASDPTLYPTLGFAYLVL